MMKQKTIYEAPTVEPVELHIENCILEGSVPTGTRNAYTVDNEEDWE